MNKDDQINSHIEEYLDYYCGLEAPGFAILPKGQWGAGKTWFIRKYLKELEEKQQGDDEKKWPRRNYEKAKEKQQKYLYVSLYGMTSFSEIEIAFFQELIPQFKSKGMAFTGRIITEVFKNNLKLDLNKLDLPNFLTNIDESILIFDDLERCKIDLGNILGYINSFVEHQGLKVIIIANEDELFKPDNGNSPSGYKAIKEKLIGKTFEVSPDLHGSLEYFISKVQESDLRKFLSINTKVIEDVYKRAEHENLRNLKQIILDFERIFKELPEKARKKPEFLQDLLKSLMAFSIEIKRGTMLPEDIKNFREDFIFVQIEQNNLARNMQSSQLAAPVRSYYEETHRKNAESIKLHEKLSNYSGLYFGALLFPSKVWWEAFFDKGIIDRLELEQSLPNSRHFQDEHTPNWLQLWDFMKLDDNKFEILLKQVESEYANKKFLAIGEIMHVVGIFLKLSDIGVYEKSKKCILEDAKLYFDKLEDSSQLDLSQYDSSLAFPRYYGHGFHGKELQEFVEFRFYIDEVLELARVKNMSSVGQDLLDTMESNTEKFCEMICSRNSQSVEKGKQTYYEMPILKFIEPCAFISRLLSINFEEQQNVFQALSERYRAASYSKRLLEELEWLKSVQKLSLEEADNRKGKLSGYQLNQLNVDYLNETIEELEK